MDSQMESCLKNVLIHALLPVDKQIELMDRYKEKRNNDLKQTRQTIDQINLLMDEMKKRA